MSKSSTVYLTESYLIDRQDSRWEECDEVAWLSKNVYNCTLYLIRQTYFADLKHFQKTGEWGTSQKQLTYKNLYKMVREEYPADYKALPKRVTNETIKQVIRDWESYTTSSIDYRKNPHKYKARPRFPNYKNTCHGRNSLNMRKKRFPEISALSARESSSYPNYRLRFKWAIFTIAFDKSRI